VKLFMATTTVKGKFFVDWFEAETIEAAKAQCDSLALECGLPMDERRTVVYAECDRETLKPV